MENGLDKADDEQGYSSQTAVSTLVEWFEDAEETTEDARKRSERDRDYYDHIQFTDKELQVLRERGQPDIIINRIQPKINYLIGYEATNRTDPRAFPRTPQDEQASEAATDAIRYVEDDAELKELFSATWENMLIEGFGGLELVIEPGQNGDQIKAVGWDWDRLFYDPHSRKLDFSDARYLGGVIWMDAEEAKAKWPDQAELIDQTIGNEAELSRTYDDRPTWKKWSSGGSRKRVRIVQMYHLEGNQWWYCVFTKGGKLESLPVPFVDQDGQSYCPLYLQSAFVNRKNERYGIVRQMISVQDEINKRRAKALHRVTMRQVRSEKGAVDDVDLARKEVAKPDGWVETNPGFAFEILPNGDQLNAELAMLQEAKNEIELFGPNAALQGKDSDAPSGKAILANQQGGQTEIGVIYDRYASFKKRVYNGVWSLIRQYKTEEWWIRVTDDEKKAQFVGFNRQVTFAEELEKRLTEEGNDPQIVQQQLQQAASDPMMAQQLQMVVRVENQPTEMGMDITVEHVPDMANVAEEQFQALVQLAPAVTFPPKVYLKASSLRNKEELIQELEGQQMSPEQQQMQAELEALALEERRAQVAKINAEIRKLTADALKTSVDADMAQANAIGLIQEPRVLTSDASPPPGETGVIDNTAAGFSGV